MFSQVHYPETLDPRELDAYLARGWYRMGQTIFTTNFLNFKNQLYSAIWLRVVLEAFSPDRNGQKLFRKNAAFKTDIKVASISPEQEALYANYKRSVPFEVSPSLKTLLFGDVTHNVYATYEVNVFDGDRLIAAGFFDIGEDSAMGITSIYDPSYRKYSLGKHLIYLKMSYCKKMGLHYFYPGYFVPGYPFFDYKLAIGKPAIQYLQLSSQQWLPIDKFSPATVPLQVMHNKLQSLLSLLVQSKMEVVVLQYEYFYVNQTPGSVGEALFDFPVFLCSRGAEAGMDPIIVYDVCDGRYHLMKCSSVWRPPSPNWIQGFYSEHLLKMDQDLFSTEVMEEMVSVFKAYRDEMGTDLSV